MKEVVFIVVIFVCIGGIVLNLPNALFKRCEHPEKWATFVRNIYGDEINLLNGRSIWKAKWWPFFLIHQYLWEEEYDMKEQESKFNLDRLREIAKPATPHKRLTPEDREKAMKTLLPEYIRRDTLIEYLTARKKDITLKMIPGQEDPVMYGKLTMCKEMIDKLNSM